MTTTTAPLELKRGDRVVFWHPRGGYYMGTIRRLCRRPLRDGRPACWVKRLHGEGRLILVPLESCRPFAEAMGAFIKEAEGGAA